MLAVVEERRCDGKVKVVKWACPIGPKPDGIRDGTRLDTYAPAVFGGLWSLLHLHGAGGISCIIPLHLRAVYMFFVLALTGAFALGGVELWAA